MGGVGRVDSTRQQSQRAEESVEEKIQIILQSEGSGTSEGMHLAIVGANIPRLARPQKKGDVSVVQDEGRREGGERS